MKKWDIVYSVTAHESVECLWDLYFNIRKFHKGLDVLVIFHCTPALRKEAMAMMGCEATNPIFHPNPTIKARFTSSIFLAHLANYRHIEDQGIQFNYFCTLASNCLFVRPVDMGAIRESTRSLAYTMPNYDLGDEDRWQAQEFKRNPQLVRVFQKRGIAVKSTIHEGAYFKAGVIKFISDFCHTNSINEGAFPCDTLAAEEVILPSIEAWACGGEFSRRYGVWIPGIKLEDVRQISETGRCRSTVADWYNIVKVPRDMNNEIRKYINTIPV